MNANVVTRRHLLGALASAAGMWTVCEIAAPAAADTSRATRRFKTIGVLGGIGPQATIDFEARLHAAAQRLLPQRENSGYPPMVVYYHREPPFAMNADGAPRVPFEAHPALLDAATRLGAWADFLVITSNGPHVVSRQIADAAGRPVLSLIDVTLREVRRRQWRRAGVLAFKNPIVYTAPLQEAQIASETLAAAASARLDVEIMKVMEGRSDAASIAVARQAVENLRGRGVDGVILGCTEIPLLLADARRDTDLIDPLELLAEAAVAHASA